MLWYKRDWNLVYSRHKYQQNSRANKTSYKRILRNRLKNKNQELILLIPEVAAFYRIPWLNFFSILGKCSRKFIVW